MHELSRYPSPGSPDMKKSFIVNGHHPTEPSPGRLNSTLAAPVAEVPEAKGYEVRRSDLPGEWHPPAELARHRWADVLVLQTPANRMEVSRRFEPYMDEVFSAGIVGQLCGGDGRTRKDLATHYGTGGSLGGRR